ncbi:MAG: cell division protein ZapA, partial [Acetobacteraceae bacterium]
MAEVSVRINGYVYTVGCEDGQETHLQAMAAEVDGRIASIKAVGAQSGEARLLM